MFIFDIVKLDVIGPGCEYGDAILICQSVKIKKDCSMMCKSYFELCFFLLLTQIGSLVLNRHFMLAERDDKNVDL